MLLWLYDFRCVVGIEDMFLIEVVFISYVKCINIDVIVLVDLNYNVVVSYIDLFMFNE